MRSLSAQRSGRGKNSILISAMRRGELLRSLRRAGGCSTSTSPVKFQRMPGMGALPIPEPDGDIERLRRFTNLNNANFSLVYVAVLADALCPGRPHVIST